MTGSFLIGDKHGCFERCGWDVSKRITMLKYVRGKLSGIEVYSIRE